MFAKYFKSEVIIVVTYKFKFEKLSKTLVVG